MALAVVLQAGILSLERLITGRFFTLEDLHFRAVFMLLVSAEVSTTILAGELVPTLQTDQRFWGRGVCLAAY